MNKPLAVLSVIVGIVILIILVQQPPASDPNLLLGQIIGWLAVGVSVGGGLGFVLEKIGVDWADRFALIFVVLMAAYGTVNLIGDVANDLVSAVAAVLIIAFVLLSLVFRGGSGKASSDLLV